MKAKLKYPIFSFAPKGNMICVPDGKTIHNDQYQVVEETKELYCGGCNGDKICRNGSIQSEMARNIRVLYQVSGACDYH